MSLVLLYHQSPNWWLLCSQKDIHTQCGNFHSIPQPAIFPADPAACYPSRLWATISRPKLLPDTSCKKIAWKDSKLQHKSESPTLCRDSFFGTLDLAPRPGFVAVSSICLIHAPLLTRRFRIHGFVTTWVPIQCWKELKDLLDMTRRVFWSHPGAPSRAFCIHGNQYWGVCVMVVVGGSRHTVTLFLIMQRCLADWHLSFQIPS